MPLLRKSCKPEKRLYRNLYNNDIINSTSISIRKNNMGNPIFPTNKIVKMIVLNNQNRRFACFGFPSHRIGPGY